MSVNDHHEEEDAYLQAEDAEEIVERDEDHPMESDDEGEDQDNEGDQNMDFEPQEIVLQNDSLAHFDHHKDSSSASPSTQSTITS